eukprot:65560-Amorphochlora_amoeboformis.AAC.1
MSTLPRANTWYIFILLSQVNDPSVDFDFGVIPPSNSNMLSALENVLREIYIPMIESQTADHTSVAEPRTRTSDEKNQKAAGEGVRIRSSNGGGVATGDEEAGGATEMRIKLKQFSTHVTHVMQKVSGNVKLPVPDIIIESSDVKKAATDVKIIAKLKPVLDDWINLIIDVLDNEQNKSRPVQTPMGEINFWKDGNATLSGLYEQITMPKIRNFVKVLELAEVVAIDSFKKQLGKLMKRYVEAKDNVKFLSTLERHFKNLDSGKLSVMLDTIPSMMESLRMAIEKLKQAIAVLRKWYASFHEVKRQIAKDSENSGMAQWNFERKLLFDKTTYMAEACETLMNMVKTSHQFRNFLGKELQNVTGDSKAIEKVRKEVDESLRPIRTLRFSIFDEMYNKMWRDVQERYQVTYVYL